MGSVKLIDSVEPFEASSAFAVEVMPKNQERFELAAAFVERMADLAAVMAAETLAYVTFQLLQIGRHLHYSGGSALSPAIGFAVLFVLLLDHAGAQSTALKTGNARFAFERYGSR